MNSEVTSDLTDKEANALLDSLGSSINRVLESTNSVKIKGLGAFRKSQDGIRFVAADELNSFVNADFEGLDIVSYDSGDLARSHVKREEFSFDSNENSLKGQQTEIISEDFDLEKEGEETGNGTGIAELLTEDEAEIVEFGSEIETHTEEEFSSEKSGSEKTENLKQEPAIEAVQTSDLSAELPERNDPKAGVKDVLIGQTISDEVASEVETLADTELLTDTHIIEDAETHILQPESEVRSVFSDTEDLSATTEIIGVEDTSPKVEEMLAEERKQDLQSLEGTEISESKTEVSGTITEIIASGIDLGEPKISDEVIEWLDKKVEDPAEKNTDLVEEDDAIVVIFDEAEEEIEIPVVDGTAGEFPVKDDSSERSSSIQTEGFMGDSSSPGPGFDTGDDFNDQEDSFGGGVETDFADVSDEKNHNAIVPEAEGNAAATLKDILAQTEKEAESGELEQFVEKTGFEEPINKVPELTETNEIPDTLPDLEDLTAKVSGVDSNEPSWIKETKGSSAPFPNKIKKTSKEFAEKGDSEIRERRAAARIERAERRKRRMLFSLVGVIFTAAVLSFFWWMINRNGADATASQIENQEVLEASTQTISTIEGAPRDFPRIIDYSDPASMLDLDRGKFTWILYSTNELRDAQLKSDYYNSLDFKNDIIKVRLGGLDTYRISFGRFNSYNEATEADNALPYGIQGTWVDKLEDSFNSSQSSP